MVETSPDRPRIAIVGSGVVGLIIAQGLISRGLANVTVYEQASSVQENGAGVGFTRNAIECMRLVSPVVEDVLNSISNGSGMDDDEDDYLQWIDGFNGDEEKLLIKLSVGKDGFQGCHRQHLLMGLLGRLPAGTVQFSKRVESLVEDPDTGVVTLGFGDGRSACADAVIACDGIKSRVRRLLLGDKHPSAFPRYTHKVAFRALIPIDKAIEALGEYKALHQHMHIGPNRHLVHFPVANRTLLNLIVFNSDPEPWQHEKLVATGTREEICEAFKDWSKCVRDLLALFPDTVTTWGIFDMADNPMPYYAKGQVCLAGDAAHAAAPHHGAGAGMGVEDALALVTALETALTMVPSRSLSLRAARRNALKVGFKAFETARMERSQWLVQSSRQACEIYQLTFPGTGQDISKCEHVMRTRSHKIWYFDYKTMLAGVKEDVKAQMVDAVAELDVKDAAVDHSRIFSPTGTAIGHIDVSASNAQKVAA